MSDENRALRLPEGIEGEMLELESNKLQEVLRSRRFWAVVLSISAAIAVEYCGFRPDQVERINQVIMVLVGIYIGSLSIEDALKQLGGLEKLMVSLIGLVTRFKK